MTELEKMHWTLQKKYIPNGVQTFSKMPSRFVEGVYPLFIRRASGCTVEDLEGKVYTDFVCSLGAIILGHCDSFVDRRVKAQIDEGVLYSLPSTKEWTLAKRLKNAIPCAEKAKFFKTGSEAVAASIRVARAHTQREKVVACGYHGWHDWYTVSTENDLGIPVGLKSLISKFEYNNIEQLEQLLSRNDVAAVIMEPVQFEEPEGYFLHQVSKLCEKYGTILIFDEILTGIRVSVGGAQRFFGVTPQLAVFSKALGNGYPIAVLVGKSDVMDVYEQPGFFVSGTFNGDLIGIEAANAVLDRCNEDREDAVNVIKKIWASGEVLKEGFNTIAESLGLDGVSCVGLPVRTKFVFPNQDARALFLQECAKRQVLFGPSNFIMLAHSQFVIRSILNIVSDSLTIVKDNLSNLSCKLEGTVPKEIVIR